MISTLSSFADQNKEKSYAKNLFVFPFEFSNLLADLICVSTKRNVSTLFAIFTTTKKINNKSLISYQSQHHA